MCPFEESNEASKTNNNYYKKTGRAYTNTLEGKLRKNWTSLHLRSQSHCLTPHSDPEANSHKHIWTQKYLRWKYNKILCNNKLFLHIVRNYNITTHSYTYMFRNRTSFIHIYTRAKRDKILKLFTSVVSMCLCCWYCWMSLFQSQKPKTGQGVSGIW